MNRLAMLGSMFILLVCFCGCGGGGGGTANNQTVMSFATRQAAMTAVQQQFRSLFNQDPAVANPQIAAFMKARPEFEDAGVSSDGCAWGRFTDGRLLIVANNRRPAAGKAAALPRGRAVGTELPGSGSAKVFNAMGPVFGDPTPTISSILKSGGYDVTTGIGGVEDFRAIKGDAVVYINVHSGSGVDGKNNQMFATWTGERFSANGEQRLAGDLSSGRILYMLAEVNVDKSGAVISEWHYAITSSFVSTYMKFAPNSLLFSTGCFSDNAGFKAACFGAGLQVYGGWTDELDDNTSVLTSEFFFDRLLSTNKISPLQVPVPAPPDWATVRTQMATEKKPDGLTFDTALTPKSGATPKLILSEGQGSLGTVVPSIASSMIDPAAGELTLNGTFGSTQGSVFFNAQFLQVKSWTSTQIVAVSPGTSGPVQVTVGKLLSNIVVVGSTPCGTLPKPFGPRGTVPPTLTLDKTDYHAGDTMTVTVGVPGVKGLQTWVADFFNNDNSKPAFLTVLTLDETPPPVGSVIVNHNGIEVRGPINQNGATETHVITLRVKTPIGLDGQPEMQCAAGLTSDGHLVGPDVDAQLFGPDGGTGDLIVFFNASP